MTPQEAIDATISAWGAGNPAALRMIAFRESRFNPYARGDLDSAPLAYERVKDDLIKMRNPWARDAERWDASLGLYQTMPAYYARLWHPQADPQVLLDPRIATVVAGRIWNKAVLAGADDFVRVRLYWANPRLMKIDSDHPEYQKRLDRFSIVDGQLNPRVSQFDYRSFGTGPQAGQDARLPGGPAKTEEMSPLRMISLGFLLFRLWKAYGR
jgi:hypothetical protein